TILALKALMAATGRPGGEGRRLVDVELDGQTIEKLDIPADQAEVMKQVDLSAMLKPGTQKLTLRDRDGSGVAFQVAFRYHVPGEPPAPAAEALTIDLKYDRQALAVNEPLKVTATITNRTNRVAPMVIADLPIPAGFTLDGVPQSQAGNHA